MSTDIRNVVQSKYGAVATSGLSTENTGVREVAEAFGYAPDDLAAIPAGANMGLSCGNPTASASLRAGETVVDLGCGGGMDVFLAAQQVGPSGQVIGVDMTPEMIELARRNAANGIGGKPFGNVDFRLGHIDALPLDDASADCVISNCVINLAPDKRAVFREIFRVLKPGGRVAVSDIALKKPLPPELAKDVMAYVGCIAGAISIDDYRRGLAEAGFAGVVVTDTGADLNAYAKVDGQSGCCSPAMPAAPPSAETSRTLSIVGSSCCGGTSCVDDAPASTSTVHGGLATLLERYNVNDYAASVRVYAVKPK